jgi:hypothetical protein
LLLNQINEVRGEIKRVEDELLALRDESIATPARQHYWEAFAAELAGELAEALKLYKNATRQSYHDASAAVRSVRYKMKSPRVKSLGRVWTSVPVRQSRYQLLMGLSLLLIIILLVALVSSLQLFSRSEAVVAEAPTATSTATPTLPLVILIVPDTPTPSPTPTLTPVPSTPTLSSDDEEEAAPSPTDTSMLLPTPTLKAAPRVIEPKNGLTWGDGAIVFEFEELNLASDELYCLDTLRGFDRTNTENWSFPPVGSKSPYIPVEANVFRVAKASGMRCIIWSAGIGKGTCDNIISHKTEARMIGLPETCKF